MRTLARSFGVLLGLVLPMLVGSETRAQHCSDWHRLAGGGFNETPRCSPTTPSTFRIRWYVAHQQKTFRCPGAGTGVEMNARITSSEVSATDFIVGCDEQTRPYFQLSVNGKYLPLCISDPLVETPPDWEERGMCEREMGSYLEARFDRSLLVDGNNTLKFAFDAPALIANIDAIYCNKARTTIPLVHELTLLGPEGLDKSVLSATYLGSFSYDGSFPMSFYDPRKEFAKALDQLLQDFDQRLAQYQQLLPAQQERYRQYNEKLRQFAEKLTNLFSKDILEVAASEIAALVADLGAGPELEQALLKKITDFLDLAKKQIGELRDEVKGLVAETTQKMEEMVNKIANNVLGEGFDLNDLDNYQPSEQLSQVPEISIPEITEEKPYTDENNPYLAFANEVISQLLSKTNGAVVVDRGGFIDIVLAWRKRQIEFEMLLLGGDVIIQKEADAFRSANEKVQNTILQFMDDSGWFRDHVAPQDARAFLDGLIDPKSDTEPTIREKALRLKLEINRWSPAPKPEMATFFTLLSGFRSWYEAYKLTRSLSLDPGDVIDISRATESLMESLINTAASIGVSFVPFVGDSLDFCELVTGKEMCRPDGPDLSSTGRIFSGLGLIAGSGVFWRTIGKIGTATPQLAEGLARVAEQMSDLAKSAARSLAKRLKKLSPKSLEYLQELNGREIEDLLNELGDLNVSQLANGAGFCFEAGTLVHTDSGMLPIERIHVGTRVLSRDEKTGRNDYKRVSKVYVTPNRRIFEITTAKNGVFHTTEEHPFYVNGVGWIPAKDLRPGYRVFSATQGSIEISSGKLSERSSTVYNFEVEDFHTYFVGEVGLWVHNNPCGDPTMWKLKLSPETRVFFEKGMTRRALDNHYEDLIRNRTGGLSKYVPHPDTGNLREVDCVTENALIQAKRSYAAIDNPAQYLSMAHNLEQIEFTVRAAKSLNKRAEFWFKYGVHASVRQHILDVAKKFNYESVVVKIGLGD